MRAPLAVIALLACLAVLAGCGGGTSASGERIDVFGPYTGVEADAFAASLDDFERRTGTRVDYTGSVDFVADLRQRVESGIDQPDVALVPQPGFIRELVEGGDLVTLSPATVREVADDFGLTERELRNRGGADYVVPYRASIKSLVWYRPAVFAEHGWAVPRTLAELADLVEEIDATEGIAPWCFGIFAGTSTGWTATDWVEDLLLRRAGPEAYDEWVAGTRPFSDAEVRAAFLEFQRLVLEPGRAAGGLRAVLETPVAEAGAALVSDPAGCALYKQASFAADWFPDDVTLGPGGDVDAFVLPGVATGGPAPLVLAGDGAVQFTRSAAVDRLMTYLASPDGAREWAARGGFLSARSEVDPAEYYRGVQRGFARLLGDDRVTRFDGSDLMPLQIGSELFWQQVTLWIAGVQSLDDLARTMDAARRRE